MSSRIVKDKTGNKVSMGLNLDEEFEKLEMGFRNKAAIETAVSQLEEYSLSLKSIEDLEAGDLPSGSDPFDFDEAVAAPVVRPVDALPVATADMPMAELSDQAISLPDLDAEELSLDDADIVDGPVVEKFEKDAKLLPDGFEILTADQIDRNKATTSAVMAEFNSDALKNEWLESIEVDAEEMSAPVEEPVDPEFELRAVLDQVQPRAAADDLDDGADADVADVAPVAVTPKRNLSEILANTSDIEDPMAAAEVFVSERAKRAAPVVAEPEIEKEAERFFEKPKPVAVKPISVKKDIEATWGEPSVLQDRSKMKSNDTVERDLRNAFTDNDDAMADMESSLDDADTDATDAAPKVKKKGFGFYLAATAVAASMGAVGYFGLNTMTQAPQGSIIAAGTSMANPAMMFQSASATDPMPSTPSPVVLAQNPAPVIVAPIELVAQETVAATPVVVATPVTTPDAAADDTTAVDEAPAVDTADAGMDTTGPQNVTDTVLEDLRSLAVTPAAPEVAGGNAQTEAPAAFGQLDNIEAPAIADIDLNNLFLTGADETPEVVEIAAPVPTVSLEEFEDLAQRYDVLNEDVNGIIDSIAERDEIITSIQAQLMETMQRAERAESLSIAQNQVLVRFVAAEEKLEVAEQLIVDLSRRIASVESFNPADRDEVEAKLNVLDESFRGLQRDVGMVARMAINGSPTQVTGRTAAQPLSNFDKAQGAASMRPAFATPDAVPSNVKVGDLVNGYGEVLEIFGVADGGRMVVMENGTVVLN